MHPRRRSRVRADRSGNRCRASWTAVFQAAAYVRQHPTSGGHWRRGLRGCLEQLFGKVQWNGAGATLPSDSPRGTADSTAATPNRKEPPTSTSAERHARSTPATICAGVATGLRPYPILVYSSSTWRASLGSRPVAAPTDGHGAGERTIATQHRSIGQDSAEARYLAAGSEIVSLPLRGIETMSGVPAHICQLGRAPVPLTALQAIGLPQIVLGSARTRGKVAPRSESG
jgi:hypothetical protein